MIRLDLPSTTLDFQVVRPLAQTCRSGKALAHMDMRRVERRLLLGDGNDEALTPARTPTLQDRPALLGLHPLAEAVRALPLDVARLVRPLAHDGLLFRLRERVWLDDASRRVKSDLAKPRRTRVSQTPPSREIAGSVAAFVTARSPRMAHRKLVTETIREFRALWITLDPRTDHVRSGPLIVTS